MSGATEARDKLRKVIDAVYAPIHSAGRAYVKVYQAAALADDLVETMQQSVLLVIASEHLKEMASEAEKSLRSILSETMGDTGATTIETSGVKAYLSRKPAWVSIDQTDLVPQSFYTQPPPTIDRKAIKAAIEAGDDVPGCSLIKPNDTQLNLRSKKE